jgi:hypothetical protein
MWLLDLLFRHNSSVKSMEAAREAKSTVTPSDFQRGEALFEKEVVPRLKWCYANRFLVDSARPGKAAQLE